MLQGFYAILVLGFVPLAIALLFLYPGTTLPRAYVVRR